MRRVNNILNQIVISALSRKKTISVVCTKKVLSYLDVLVSINAIEYEKDMFVKDLYIININYYNQAPVIKRVKYMGNVGNGSLSKKRWDRELNCRRGIYIVRTCRGLKVTSSLVSIENPNSLIYKLFIN